MLRVLITVDTEVWPLAKQTLWSPKWDLKAEEVRDSFNAHILGRTLDGDFGVPYLLRRLDHFGCRAVFFVEPLFAREVGDSCLREIVQRVGCGGQQVELHLHTEWNEKGRNPLVPATRGRNIRDYGLADQISLISEGASLLKAAGVRDVTAFRAGGYAANADTLRALGEVGIPIDSSLNGSIGNSGDEALRAMARSHSSFRGSGVMEVPVTVYRDRSAHWRHAQLAACSAMELKHLLDQAFAQRCRYFVVVLHGSKLLTRDKAKADPMMLRRLDSLLAFLQRNGERFQTVGFADIAPELSEGEHGRHAHDLSTPLWMTGLRMLEQARSPRQ